MEPKKLKIETTPELPAVTSPPTEEKARRKGLPAEGEPWKASEHDMVVMGRLSRAIEGVPPAAMKRIAPWFTSLLNEAMRDPHMVESLAIQLNERLDELRKREVAQREVAQDVGDRAKERAKGEVNAGIAPWNAAGSAYEQG